MLRSGRVHIGCYTRQLLGSYGTWELQNGCCPGRTLTGVRCVNYATQSARSSVTDLGWPLSGLASSHDLWPVYCHQHFFTNVNKLSERMQENDLLMWAFWGIFPQFSWYTSPILVKLRNLLLFLYEKLLWDDCGILLVILVSCDRLIFIASELYWIFFFKNFKM